MITRTATARISILLLLILFTGRPVFPQRRRAVRPPLPPGMAEVRRVFVVVLENTDLGAAMAQPFLRSLADRGALLRNYHALTHPSHPNYIAMVSGSTQGVVGSDPVTIDAPHIADLLEARRLSWKVYAEDYPGGCFLGETFADGDPGLYVRRHLPLIEFMNVQFNAVRCARIVHDSEFDLDLREHRLPDFAMYIPDTFHDGHDTSVADADVWLKSRFESLLADPNFMSGMLFIVLFDEGSNAGPNVVYCSLNGTGVQPGTVSDSWYDHYSFLRTIEEIFHTGTLHQHDETADVIKDVWRR